MPSGVPLAGGPQQTLAPPQCLVLLGVWLYGSQSPGCMAPEFGAGTGFSPPALFPPLEW